VWQNYTFFPPSWVSFNAALCDSGSIRVVSSGHILASTGRVEVCINSTWGTICDQFWDHKDARLACKAAGYSEYGIAITFLRSNTYVPHLCMCFIKNKKKNKTKKKKKQEHMHLRAASPKVFGPITSLTSTAPKMSRTFGIAL